MTGYPHLQMLIDGQWRDAAPGQPVINPADERTIGTVPHASEQDLDDAVRAAQIGFSIWSRTAPADRAEILLRAARLIRERIEPIATALTLEQGKPLGQSRLEVLRACTFLEWDANEGRRVYGRIIPAEPGLRHLVIHQPVGIVAAFSPWNFPISIPARKVGGALAAGCAVILKASEETPAGAMSLVAALVDAGVPPGALNLVFGNPSAISDFLIPHPSVRLVTFTGSIPVGKHLAELAGRHMKPAIMELGGHAPVIVCDDVDPVASADQSATANLRNAGQVCVSPTRFFVQDRIYERFVEAFVSRADRVKIGDGLDPSVELGPLASLRRVEAMEAFVADAVSHGANVASGGSRVGNQGCYFPLTVLTDVPDDAQVMREEPFGPIAIVNRVQDLDEAIGKANMLPYGLAAYAFTGSAHNAEQMSDRIECGNLAINHFTASLAETPFGGVKDSGYGREGGTEGLVGYTTVKNISHRVS
ncbi:MAG: NAD-dependent succinate-semialdehyde dehydrogenase [Alphaproteobacteria bacterium]|nr:NAD-dependent succinate-semialdehyde dehydrogenase [Alphaproteobacteria bacterium]